MDDGFGRGMNYRLQGVRFPASPATAGAADTFDLALWQGCSTLEYFGVELHVTCGSATVRLWHEQNDGTRIELALLDCRFEGSAFSPPLHLAALAQKGGRLVPELLHSNGEAGRDAAFDLYFGTNDLPTNPEARIVFLGSQKGASHHKAPDDVTDALRHDGWFSDLNRTHAPLHLAQHCAFLREVAPHADREALETTGPAVLHHPDVTTDPQLGLRQMAHALAYGALSTNAFTHFAILPAMMDLQKPPLRTDFEEQILRSLALALFLRQEAIVHTGLPQCQETSSPWPTALFDLRQFYERGLPDRPLDSYLARLSGQGATLFATDAQTIPLHPRSWRARIQSARQRLAKPEPKSDLRWTRLSTHNQLRQRALAQQQQIETLKQRLNPLMDSMAVAADRERANRLTLSLLRNRHRGQRAVIIGNGPSLQIADLDRLHNDVTFASNKIYLAYGDTFWRPTYYSVEDHLVLLNNLAEIEALQDSIKLFPANTRDFGYHAADTIFAPFLPPRSFEDPLSDPAFPAFSTDLTHGISWGSTIVYSQIQMALFMGCTEIVLIGVDHNYQLPATKRGNQYVYAGERNHFHPNYRSPGEAWHQPNLDVLEVSYTRALQACKEKGVQIVNASRKTKLDVFDRADFDILFPPTGAPA